MDPDGFAEVKNGCIPLEGTRTEQLDLILSPLGSTLDPRGPIRSILALY